MIAQCLHQTENAKTAGHCQWLDDQSVHEIITQVGELRFPRRGPALWLSVCLM